MPHLHPIKLLLAAALAGAGIGQAQADPFMIRYTGVIADSNLPEIVNGQLYKVIFVLDNGGTSANSQTWTGAHLVCTIWQINNAGNVVFFQNLASVPANAGGSVTTDAAGGMLTMFSEVLSVDAVAPGNHALSGLPPGHVQWWTNGDNYVFRHTHASTSKAFSDLAGGVSMSAGSWTRPLRLSSSPCASPPAPPSQGTVAVPALGPWGLAALAGALGLLGAPRRARRR